MYQNLQNSNLHIDLVTTGSMTIVHATFVPVTIFPLLEEERLSQAVFNQIYSYKHFGTLVRALRCYLTLLRKI